MNISSQPDTPQTMPDAGLHPVLASVVIPAYNCSDCIVEALNSALEQKSSGFEVIVVNDGSPDTPQLEQALEPYRQRIRYIKQENQGPSGARNTGILAARGKYVAFLDSDDLWRPGHLARQIALLEANSSLGLVYADAMLTVDGVPVRTYFEDCPQSHPVTFESLVKEECSVITSATVARRDALVQAGLFDGQFRRCEDFDLWTRIVQCGYQVDFVREIQIVHRSRNGLSSDAESMKRSLAAVYKKMSQLPVSKIQKDLILERQAQAEAELRLELCRKSLLAGDHVQARAEAEAAVRVLDNWRLRLAVLALRVAPLPFAASYRAYARILARRRRARLERLRKIEWQQLGVHGK